MKTILLCVCVFLYSAGTGVKAQSILNFNNRLIDCEDKWVAFQMNKDSSYNFDFVYFDVIAGLTLYYEGTFKINADGIFIPAKIDTTQMSWRSRIGANNTKVAIIPGNKYKELKIGVPEWLQAYKHDSASIEELYNRGFLYNSWGECVKALSYLEKAWKIDASYPGLAVEFAFAYNTLKQYDKAKAVAERQDTTEADNCSLNKELTYALIHLGQLDAAEKLYTEKISGCESISVKSETALDIGIAYYNLKNKNKFIYWAQEAKKWGKENAAMMDNINQLVENME